MPVVPAVKVMVPVAVELPFTTMLPAAPVVRVRPPTVDALRLTPSVSITNTEPVVELAKDPAVVRISDPTAPILPEPEMRVTVPLVNVPAVRVIVPAPSALNDSDVAAVRAASTTMLPPEPAAVAIEMLGAVIDAAEVLKLAPTIKSNRVPAVEAATVTPELSVM